MSATIHFDAKGFNELMAKLDHLDFVAGQKVMSRGARTAMKTTVEGAKQLAHRDYSTHQLENSIRYAGRKGKGFIIWSGGIVIGKKRLQAEEYVIPEGDGTIVETIPAVYADASWRWHFTELGTVNHPPYPYLRPAFYQRRIEIVDRFRAYLEKVVERIKSGQGVPGAPAPRLPKAGGP